MGEAELENLALFYRTMTTEQLLDYRAALRADSKEAERDPKRAKRTKDFCATRIEILTRILGERGVVEQ